MTVILMVPLWWGKLLKQVAQCHIGSARPVLCFSPFACTCLHFSAHVATSVAYLYKACDPFATSQTGFCLTQVKKDEDDKADADKPKSEESEHTDDGGQTKADGSVKEEDTDMKDASAQDVKSDNKAATEEDKQKEHNLKELAKEEPKEKMPETPVLQLHGKLSPTGMCYRTAHQPLITKYKGCPAVSGCITSVLTQRMCAFVRSYLVLPYNKQEDLE